ncbi:MAG: DnaJ C-terminal domain-containing protein [Collinsella sp.]
MTLEEAALGCKKTISYDRLAPVRIATLRRAEGAQETVQPLPRHGLCHDGPALVLGQVQSSSPCPDCHGEGTVIDHPARPATVRAARLRMKRSTSIFRRRFDRSPAARERLWRGRPSRRAFGDLIVNVRVADHERFKRNGDDLYLVSDISIAQAALGCEIEVEGIMPDEVVKVTVPPVRSTATPLASTISACRASAVAVTRSTDRATARGRPHQSLQ